MRSSAKDRLRFDGKWATDEGGCHVWFAQKLRNGYGIVWYQGRKHTAHRVSWMISNGQIPEGLEVAHSCDVRACVNPEHLWLASHAENMADMKAKHRQPTGERNGTAKLTAASVSEVRRKYSLGGVTHMELATSLGVTSSAIQLVVSRKAWRHVP